MTAWLEGDAANPLVLDLWPDAASLQWDVETILDAAQEQCEAYAPALATDALVPERYKVALVMQARAIHRALMAGSGDQIGADGMTVTVYPMDRTVKGLLRPRAGVPRVS